MTPLNDETICLHCKRIIYIGEEITAINTGHVNAVNFLCYLCRGKLKLTAKYEITIEVKKDESN